MKCPNCGYEIRDGSKFCTKCGTPLAGEAAAAAYGTSNPENPENPEQKDNSRIGIYVLAGLVVLVLAVIAGLAALIISGKSKEGKTAVSDIQSESVQNNDDAEQNNDAEEQEDVEEVLTGEYLLVTVPSDYMSLRMTPGLGDDVIVQLPAGKYLLWDGETTVEQERDFYKVTVEESGETGYVAANYCVPVDYRYDEGKLTIVDVSDALYTYDEMQENIGKLCDTYPECISCESVGYSFDGREIYVVTLGNPDAAHHVFVQAAIHGREYMTAQLVMKMLEYYAANYHSGSYRGRTYEELFENTAFHVIPMSNPDGVTISQFGVDVLYHEAISWIVYDCYMRDQENLVWEEDANGDMNWADYYRQEGFDREAEGKPEIISFEDYTTLWKSNANAVDLNNNFDAGWEQIQVKPEQSYGNYKGEYAVSEPETQILVEEALKREYDYFISYHAKGQLIYYDVNGNDAQTSERSYELASALSDILKYTPVNTQKGYNVNLGGFSDWVQLELHGASVTIEVGKHPCPLSITEFDSIWHRNRESWAMLCERLYDS